MLNAKVRPVFREVPNSLNPSVDLPRHHAGRASMTTAAPAEGAALVWSARMSKPVRREPRVRALVRLVVPPAGANLRISTTLGRRSGGPVAVVQVRPTRTWRPERGIAFGVRDAVSRLARLFYTAIAFASHHSQNPMSEFDREQILLKVPDEVRDLYAQGIRDGLKRLDGHVALPAFDLSNVRTVQAGPIGEHVLRPFPFQTQRPHIRTDLLLNV